MTAARVLMVTRRRRHHRCRQQQQQQRLRCVLVLVVARQACRRLQHWLVRVAAYVLTLQPMLVWVLAAHQALTPHWLLNHLQQQHRA